MDPGLTEQWEREGWRPVVGVWTASQTAEFLRHVRGYRLYALFHLVALRGLRRGEAAGLRWGDLDLDAGTLTISEQLQQFGGRLATVPPKSDAGWRVKTTVAALREHKARQQAVGAGWAETGYVFTTMRGKPVGPDRLTRLFRKLVIASGLPPATLDGLRHGAATLALAAGADLKVVQDQLGHSTIVLTADTYTKRPAGDGADGCRALSQWPGGSASSPSRHGQGAAEAGATRADRLPSEGPGSVIRCGARPISLVSQRIKR